MSKLPPALAARLAKRGIISGGTRSAPSVKTEIKFEEEEEVIAEDYDDVAKAEPFPPSFDCKIRDTVIGCPNKYNVYHNCTGYCAKQYANVAEEPSKLVKRKFVRLLRKYPLGDSVWEQVYEPGLKTYYFWNTQTDQVSWLPPLHPDAKITIPAEKLRRLLREDPSEEEDEANKMNDSNEDEDSDDESDDDSEEESTSSDESEILAPPVKRQHIQRKQISKRNELDPMDPAAYSNIPRGKWSDGLRNNNDDD